MTNVETSRFYVGGGGAIEAIHNVPHHYADQQQLNAQPQVASPFVLYLRK